MKNFTNLFIGIVLICISYTSSAQTSDYLWYKLSVAEKNSVKKIGRKNIPKNHEIFQVNFDLLKIKLSKAPSRKDQVMKDGIVMTFPNINGNLEKFVVHEASIMDEKLQEKYRTIRSYIGKSIDYPGSIVRFSISPFGINAMILPTSGTSFYIDSNISDKELCIAYAKKDLPTAETFVCKFDEVDHKYSNKISTISAKPLNADDGNLRTFRLAVATTGEYSQFHLSNQSVDVNAPDAEKKAAVLSEINVVMTRVNGIFERDVGLTMVLVANNTDVIFLNPNTDGLTNEDSTILINESQTVIDANIGSSNYDIGHTFGTGGGGLAQLYSPCTGNKARGVTGLPSPIGDNFYIDYVSHEMGHQFGAHHTFNGDAGSCGDNRNNGTAVEPGSGSTIMSYSGLCAGQNIQNRSDDYFHLVSIKEMWNNITIGISTCATITSTGNTAPTIGDLQNYTIPISTPFVLDANATDVDGDNVTYTWEQLDTEIVTAPPVSIATEGPVFRSLAPSTSSMRYFPNLNTVLAGNISNTWEVLPSVARTMIFGVTVRDNNISGGQSASKENTINFDDNSGPFQITSQAASTNWDAGTAQTITWDVANTNSAPISCSFVNILLSIDGGLTYPIVLANNVVNDGSHNVIVPNNTTVQGRIKIESVGNIFYDLNDANITIQAVEFTMDFDLYEQNICAPANAGYNFTYHTYLGFNEATTFSATGIPAGIPVAEKVVASLNPK